MAKKRFEDLTSEQKRIRIAEDVLEQLDRDRILARQGSYFELKVKSGEHDADDELSKILRRRKKPCTACAVGAMFTCHVLETNEFYLSDSSLGADDETSVISVNRSLMDERLLQFFSLEQLRLIECAFEMTNSFYRYDVSYDSIADDAAKFGMKHRYPKARLRAIMKNIVKNGGEFKPPKEG